MDLSATIAESKKVLDSLPIKPSPSEVEESRKAVVAIERALIEQMESIMSETPPPGFDAHQTANFHELQARKEAAACTEADAAKAPHVRIIDTHDQYQHHEEMVRTAEAAFLGIQEEKLSKDKRASIERLVLQELQRVLQAEVSELDLSGREIEAVPEIIGRLVSLEKLSVSVNNLERLPDSIVSLSSLVDLNLHKNKLTELPDAIGILPALQVLDVSQNKLANLPQSLARCSSLRELNANFNVLESLPRSFGSLLPQLSVLSLSMNKLSKLPESLGQAASLTSLDLHFNRLEGLPDSIGRLDRLQILNVSNNFADLTELPSSLGQLSSLVSLDVSNNQIKELPVELGSLEKLSRLTLDGNPWVDPPLELVQKGDVFMVKAYLNERQRQRELEAQEDRKRPQEAGWQAWIGRVLEGWGLTAWLNAVLLGLPQQQQQLLTSASVSLSASAHGGAATAIPKGQQQRELEEVKEDGQHQERQVLITGTSAKDAVVEVQEEELQVSVAPGGHQEVVGPAADEEEEGVDEGTPMKGKSGGDRGDARVLLLV